MNDGSPNCRICGARGLVPVLDLGSTPLANALLTRAQLREPEARYPLQLVFCPACTLLQITETVPPELLFREYVYFSSFSDTALLNAESIVERLISARALGPGSLAAEIASNDGYLLQYYRRRGIPVLGIEPARNVAAAAEARGIRTLAEFFGLPLARRFAETGERADVVHANNVLAHVADLNGFVAGLSLFLKEDGVGVVEVPYVRNLIEETEFDTIYHEHLCYFSLTALNHLFGRHGLAIVDIERIPIHGGSLRIFVEHPRHTAGSPGVRAMLDSEADSGMGRTGYYIQFGERVEQLRRELVSLLERLRAEGRTMAAYGASAKGSTLLNYFGAGHFLDFVVDRSTVKQGHFTPGTHLEILAPEKLLELMPDYVLLLTWNFKDEILAQQAEYRRRGGRFIVPVPSVRMI
jgi:SAM-dependent methyltransferase